MTDGRTTDGLISHPNDRWTHLTPLATLWPQKGGSGRCSREFCAILPPGHVVSSFPHRSHSMICQANRCQTSSPSEDKTGRPLVAQGDPMSREDVALTVTSADLPDATDPPGSW